MENLKLTDYFNKIQDEIMLIGWNGIVERYHPDVNPNDKESFRIFRMYKNVYLNMKKRLKQQSIL